jgi:hypothetical protein
MQMRATAQLHTQRAIDRTQHLTFDQRRAAVQRRAHAPQANAELRAIELQRAIRRLMQHTGKRRLHSGAIRYAQFDVQRECVRFIGAVYRVRDKRY